MASQEAVDRATTHMGNLIGPMVETWTCPGCGKQVHVVGVKRGAAISRGLDAAFPVMLREKVEAMDGDMLFALTLALSTGSWPTPSMNSLGPSARDRARDNLLRAFGLRALGVEP